MFLSEYLGWLGCLPTVLEVHGPRNVLGSGWCLFIAHPSLKRKGHAGSNGGKDINAGERKLQVTYNI